MNYFKNMTDYKFLLCLFIFLQLLSNLLYFTKQTHLFSFGHESSVLVILIGLCFIIDLIDSYDVLYLRKNDIILASIIILILFLSSFYEKIKSLISNNELDFWFIWFFSIYIITKAVQKSSKNKEERKILNAFQNKKI